MSEYYEHIAQEWPLFTRFTGERIVRCRDCRHMRIIDLSVFYGEHEHDWDICTRVDGVQLNVEPDGYCSWGERRQA